jgi:putative transposase
LIRQAFIKENKILTAFDVQKLMQDMDCYKECGSQAAQKTIQLVSKMWKSFFKANKDYQKHPEKYLGKPRIPKYMPKDGRQVYMLKNIQCSLNNSVFRISYKPFNQYTTRTHAQGKLMQCRFVPKGEYYIMEIVYEIDVPDCEETIDRVCSVDLGVENFITVVNNFGEQPFIVKGGEIKSVNQYFNKKKADLQSDLKKKHNKDWSKRLEKLTNKRYEKIKYLMHCISKKLVDYCILHGVDTLVIGLNKKWKQENEGMQNFTYIPYDLFINQIRSKCEQNGIKCVETEEGYTSGTSFLDNEEPTKENYDKKRRVYRGLFISKSGKSINADVNGAYQIMKKVLPDTFSEGIEDAGLHPVRYYISQRQEICQ